MQEKCFVSKSWRERNGIVVHEIRRPFEDSPQNVRYERICGRLVWPTESSPGFFSIVGRLWEGKTHFVGEERKETFQLLSEGQSDSFSLEDFFRKVTDAAVRLCCQTFYTNTDAVWEGYVESFRKYVSKKALRHHVGLEMAPYENNFLLGVQVIRDLGRENRIEIPEDTIIFDQLSRATRNDLQQEAPEIRFFAINALRHGVNAVQKYGRNIGVYSPPRGRHRKTWKNSRTRLIGRA